ncbi:MAG TPA: CmpA/NrtA family ABC transporter substrate-binding protein [Gammaproteobacteria bacterium]|jgi:ABC-type nitrate/sulfonate/bicarbonate transport system substrate-binding protein|nr:CmpA/NrtA family ABC transporter substrate-binding protein [Gammaproteobacteria bacterium]
MTRRIVAGFVPLVDAAVLVAAAELGFAREHGIELVLRKEPSWASLRDHLNLGYLDCAHALAPMPIASTIGVGQVRAECVVPFVLGRGGNAITLSTPLFEAMCDLAGASLPAEPRATAAALARVVRKRREPLTLGMVFPFSTHNFDLRYWLASAGIHPDQDVRIVAIPPPLMVESLAAGHVDGFCVGEPWNSLAVVRNLGHVVATKSQLLPRGVEKVLAVPPGLARDADTLGPLLRALEAAAAWADERANAAELARLLSAPDYLGMPASSLKDTLLGRLPLGGGEWLDDPDFLFFHGHAANVPQTGEALWLYAQMLRWGQLPPGDASREIAARVFRPDLYALHVGAPALAPPAQPFDGERFDPAHLDAYVARTRIHTPFVAATHIGNG